MDKVRKPLLRGWLHLVAFFWSIPAVVFLLRGVSSTRAWYAGLTYALSLAVAFGASALYHRGNWGPRWHARLRRLDHVTIYILIVGTYTPICLLVLKEPAATTILVLEWLMGIAGTTMVLLCFERTRLLSGLLYILMGWLVTVRPSQLLEGLTHGQLLLLMLGGVFYTLGALGYALKKPNPWPNVFGYHEVWHVLETVAATSHWLLVASILKSAR